MDKKKLHYSALILEKRLVTAISRPVISRGLFAFSALCCTAPCFVHQASSPIAAPLNLTCLQLPNFKKVWHGVDEGIVVTF